MKKYVYTECFDARPDCFARCGGKCELLKHTVFPDGVCPFYKTQEQADANDLRRRKRLRRLGLFPREVKPNG